MKETNESDRADRLARMRQMTSSRKDATKTLPRDTDVAKLVRTRLRPEETLQLRSVRVQQRGASVEVSPLR